MKRELKDNIINRVRKEHGITLADKDPIFAIITANELIFEKQIDEFNKNLELQLIEIEQVTKNYLKEGKELLEKKLTIALHEAKKRLEEPQQTKKQELTHTTTIITLVIGFILGYGLSLMLL